MGRNRRDAIARKRGDTQRDEKRRREQRCVAKGGHHEDNQGRCHVCGHLLDPHKWELYSGEKLGYLENTP